MDKKSSRAPVNGRSYKKLFIVLLVIMVIGTAWYFWRMKTLETELRQQISAEIGLRNEAASQMDKVSLNLQSCEKETERFNKQVVELTNQNHEFDLNIKEAYSSNQILQTEAANLKTSLSKIKEENKMALAEQATKLQDMDGDLQKCIAEKVNLSQPGRCVKDMNSAVTAVKKHMGATIQRILGADALTKLITNHAFGETEISVDQSLVAAINKENENVPPANNNAAVATDQVSAAQNKSSPTDQLIVASQTDVTNTINNMNTVNTSSTGDTTAQKMTQDTGTGAMPINPKANTNDNTNLKVEKLDKAEEEKDILNDVDDEAIDAIQNMDKKAKELGNDFIDEDIVDKGEDDDDIKNDIIAYEKSKKRRTNMEPDPALKPIQQD